MMTITKNIYRTFNFLIIYLHAYLTYGQVTLPNEMF